MILVRAVLLTLSVLRKVKNFMNALKLSKKIQTIRSDIILDFSIKNSSWSALNLPDGVHIHGGLLSGKISEKGIYSPSVTLTTPFGTDTKNITIIAKNRPGTEKFSILQDGVEIDKVTIPQLVASVQDGSAQEKYNCSNTQLIIPLYTPMLTYIGADDNEDVILSFRNPSYEDIALNFCDFQSVTLQDGSSKNALILQFDRPLWAWFAPFDTNNFNRWRYSNLRQWLNSSGINWFSPAYVGDVLHLNYETYNPKKRGMGNAGGTMSYAVQNLQSLLDPFTYPVPQEIYNSSVTSKGFLDFLPDDLASALLQIKVVTQVFFDDDNDNDSIEDPELVNNVDCDITFDKVFIPSLEQMFINPSGAILDDETTRYPDAGIEGSAWAYYKNLFGTENPIHVVTEGGSSDIPSSIRRNIMPNWGKHLGYDLHDFSDYYKRFFVDRRGIYQSVLTRSINTTNNYALWRLYYYNYDYGEDYADLAAGFTLDSENSVYYASPAPAFAIG